MWRRAGTTLLFPLLTVVLMACREMPQSTAETTETDVSSEYDPLDEKPKEYTYSKIPWGSGRTATDKALIAAGFRWSRLDDERDAVYTGRLAEEETTLFASFTPQNKLVQIQLVVEPPENRFFQKYKIIKEALTEKYGEPYKDNKSFDAPYKEGDDNETQAIRLGKATFNPEWWTRYMPNSDGSGKSAQPLLTMLVKDKLLIYITYSSKNWNAEYARRYKKGTGAL